MGLKRILLYLLILSVLILLTIGIATARTHEFIIQPKREVTVDTPILTPPDSVSGNMTVKGGVVDFYVASPTGIVVLCYNQTDNSVFGFTVSESGNYTFHFVNTLSAENMTAVLNYEIKFVQQLETNTDVGASAGRVIVGNPQPISPPPDSPEELESIREETFREHLSFVETRKIVNTIRDIWTNMPLRPIIEAIGILGIILLPVPFFFGISSRLNVQKK